jgi:hypothetical protein
LNAQYFIAKTVQNDQYVVLLGDQVVAGPFATAVEAVKAREGLMPKVQSDLSQCEQQKPYKHLVPGVVD